MLAPESRVIVIERMSVSSHAQHRGGHEKWKRKREETQNNNDQKKVKQVSDLFEYTIFDLKKPN